MADFNRRIERLERILAADDCVCGNQEQISVRVCPDGWSSEQKKTAEGSAGIICPTHGFRPQRIYWIGEIDAKL
jgi:hypothetical protein